MVSFLEKFNKLPESVKANISSSGVMAAMNKLEGEYKINLAAVIMKIMVKEISLLDLKNYFIFEHKFDGPKAERLVHDLKMNVLAGVADYLGIKDIPKKGDEVIKEGKDPAKNVETPQGSRYFFSEDDEEEVKVLTEEMGVVDKEKTARIETEKKVEVIIKELDINFSSSDLKERFRNVLITYTRGVRNKIEAKHALIKSFEFGGVGMDETLADQALNYVDGKEIPKHKKDQSVQNIIIVEAGREKGEEKKGDNQVKTEYQKTIDALKVQGGIMSRDVDYDFAALKKKGVHDAKQDTDKKVDAKISSSLHPVGGKISIREERPEKPQTVEEQKKAVLDTLESEEKKTKTEGEPTTIIDIKKEVNRPLTTRSAGSSGKVKMEDVKYVPKLVGPIEELASMSIVDFRRLDKDPYKAITKIKEKIGYLEEEQYAKRLEGIRAWRKSPINNIYLDMGGESMSKGVPIDKVVSVRRAANREYLSKVEMEAIMDLNNLVRF